MSDAGKALLALLGTGGAADLPSGNLNAAADIEVTATPKSSDWDRAITAMAERMVAASGPASIAAGEVVGGFAQAKLSENHHGPTEWGAPAGGPPAMVSGALAASIVTWPYGADGSITGPTTDYARIQELGGLMQGNMHWGPKKQRGGGMGWFVAREIELAPRPYWAPAEHDAIESGGITEVYVQYWTEAMEA